MEDMDEILDRISAAQEELKAQGDSAREIIAAFEARMNDAGACAVVEVKLEGEDVQHWSIYWVKAGRGKGWTIEARQMDVVAVRLPDAPLLVRLVAIKQLDRLAAAVAERMEEIVEGQKPK